MDNDITSLDELDYLERSPRLEQCRKCGQDLSPDDIKYRYEVCEDCQ